ncbi:MAG: HindVP family restriction endonuclease [Lachnospiraceae bacterium]|nr:HindVP family restriction endonuclease [Lachnospiraceae bacterium]
MPDNPRLFGIVHSNRDYSLKDTWGKNQFNSSFPAALACYLYSKGMKAVYCTANTNMNKNIIKIGIDELFGIDPLGDDIYFSFETQYTPFQKYVTGSIPRNDLVILSNGQCLTSLEIKLVALPDNPTCELSDEFFGSEIVIRPDTIIYLACSFIHALNDDLVLIKELLCDVCHDINDWSEINSILPHTYGIYNAIKRIVCASYHNQIPIIMEPIWKTEGKSPKLSDHCLDVFVWSNCGMLLLFMPSESDFITAPNGIKHLKKIGRHERTMIWLFKMLKDYAENGHFDGRRIIDELSYNTKNDKAFASNGLRTHPIMTCPELTNPRITKQEIKNIILGGGQNLLSPERRFDAIIYNSPDLFEEEV